MTNSRAKGALAEREVKRLLTDAGFPDVTRGYQMLGATGSDSADVVGLEGLHIEVKRQETMRLYDWVDQAVSDASKAKDMPVVIHRCSKDRKKPTSVKGSWLVTVRLDDFLSLYRGWRKGDQ
jgi:Holliday junction resolvase